jgi:ABC-type glycerol-3-phosphate transport system permease component
MSHQNIKISYAGFWLAAVAAVAAGAVGVPSVSATMAILVIAILPPVMMFVFWQEQPRTIAQVIRDTNRRTQ